MRAKDPACPICSADIPLDGDEKPGDEVFCSVCGAPLKLAGDPEQGEYDLEEDY